MKSKSAFVSTVIQSVLIPNPTRIHNSDHVFYGVAKEWIASIQQLKSAMESLKFYCKDVESLQCFVKCFGELTRIENRLFQAIQNNNAKNVIEIWLSGLGESETVIEVFHSILSQPGYLPTTGQIPSIFLLNTTPLYPLKESAGFFVTNNTLFSHPVVFLDRVQEYNNYIETVKNFLLSWGTPLIAPEELNKGWRDHWLSIIDLIQQGTPKVQTPASSVAEIIDIFSKVAYHEIGEVLNTKILLFLYSISDRTDVNGPLYLQLMLPSSLNNPNKMDSTTKQKVSSIKQESTGFAQMNERLNSLIAGFPGIAAPAKEIFSAFQGRTNFHEQIGIVRRICNFLNTTQTK